MATSPTGREIRYDTETLIVSKTDRFGRITYANRAFEQIAGYTHEELIGAPHSLVRHPDMPRCVFKFLWDTISSGEEIFAYVKNMAKNGDHYWVLAHVTPTFDSRGEIIGYHSNRRCPERIAVERAEGLYATLLTVEAGASSKPDAVVRGLRALQDTLSTAGKAYDELVFSLDR